MITIVDKKIDILVFHSKIATTIGGRQGTGCEHNLPGVGNREIFSSNLVVHTVLLPISGICF